jgi:hypothetical protein
VVCLIRISLFLLYVSLCVLRVTVTICHNKPLYGSHGSRIRCNNSANVIRR